MRVLLLSQVLPLPADAGPKIKTWAVLRELARHHRITLLSFSRGEPAEAVERLREVCAEVHTVPLRRRVRDEVAAAGRSLLRGTPWLVERDERRAMHRRVGELLSAGAYDAVHVDQLAMATYAREATGLFRLLDAHNAVWHLVRRIAQRSRGPRRWLLESEWRRLKRLEGGICRAFDRVLTVSEEDRRALAEAAGGGRFTVIPIALDGREHPRRTRDAAGHRLLHLGSMFWPPNVDGVRWFAAEALPEVRRRVPDAELAIVGARPPRAVRRLARSPGVRVAGYVDDAAAWIASSAALVVPLRAGSGMRVKILTALAAGLPVVTTPLGAEGIDLTPGRDALVADDAAGLADAAVTLLRDPARAASLAAAGRSLFERRYEIGAVADLLAGIYEA